MGETALHADDRNQVVNRFIVLSRYSTWISVAACILGIVSFLCHCHAVIHTAPHGPMYQLGKRLYMQCSNLLVVACVHAECTCGFRDFRGVTAYVYN